MTANNRMTGWGAWAAGAVLAAFLSTHAATWAPTTLTKHAVSALSALMLTTIVSAHTPFDESTPAGTDLNAEIVKAADAYRRAMIAGDAQAVATTYRDDAVELGPCGPPVKGRAAIDEHYRRMFQSLRITSFTFTHLDASVDGSTGYDVGTYEETAGPEGTPGMTLTGKYFVLLKHAQGMWKAAYVIFNFDGQPPPCGQ